MPAAQGVDEALMAALSCSWDNALLSARPSKVNIFLQYGEEEQAFRRFARGNNTGWRLPQLSLPSLKSAVENIICSVLCRLSLMLFAESGVGFLVS